MNEISFSESFVYVFVEAFVRITFILFVHYSKSEVKILFQLISIFNYYSLFDHCYFCIFKLVEFMSQIPLLCFPAGIGLDANEQ